MDNVSGTGGTWGRRFTSGGLVLLGVTVIVGAVVAAWQSSVHTSRMDEVESHAATVALLQDVQEESGIAATLLQQYVAEGDDALIPQIQTHSDAGLGSLLEASAQSDSAAIEDISVAGSRLTEGASRIIGLRLAGDAQGASAALLEVGPTFEEFNLAFANVIEQEQQGAVASQAKADDASDLAAGSLAVAVVAGSALGFLTLVLGARSLIKRRASGPALPA